MSSNVIAGALNAPVHLTQDCQTFQNLYFKFMSMLGTSAKHCIKMMMSANKPMFGLVVLEIACDIFASKVSSSVAIVLFLYFILTSLLQREGGSLIRISGKLGLGFKSFCSIHLLGY